MMRVIIDEKMNSWVADYIRSHRKEGCVSLHTVYSNFNTDFRATFKQDPRTITQLMIAQGSLCGRPTKGGFSIWLPEDAGKGQKWSSRLRDSVVNGTTEAEPVGRAPAKVKEERLVVDQKTEVAASVESQYVFEKIPHPETGKVDVLEFIRYVMGRLDSKFPAKPETDGAYTLVDLGLETFLIECGATKSDTVALMVILKNMALVRNYGQKKWGVLPVTAAKYFITRQLYLIARSDYKFKVNQSSKLTYMRSKPEQKSEPTAQTSEAKVSFEEEAVEALALAERLAEELKENQALLLAAQAECDRLTAELKAKPTVSVGLARQALQERIMALKKT